MLDISPVAFSIFGLPVRWYALAYIAAFIFGYIFLRRMACRPDSGLDMNKKSIDDLLTYLILGVIIGGRLGYVLFYDLSHFISHPLEIFKVWRGGMSFHGGMIGVIAAIFLYAKNWLRGLKILDLVAVITPVGLFFGRIANFINGELWGYTTESAIGKYFGNRHPSQLYEAATEGILLFIIMLCAYKFTKLKDRPGALAGLFGMCYAVFRIICEQFRMPDKELEFIVKKCGLSMGQLLSAAMFLIGAWLFVAAFRRRSN